MLCYMAFNYYLEYKSRAKIVMFDYRHFELKGKLRHWKQPWLPLTSPMSTGNIELKE